MTKREQFKNKLDGEGLILAPGVFNAFGAKMAAYAGFDTVYLSGFCVSASKLAMPDVGMLTLNDLVDEVRRIDVVSSVGVISDCEAGFGNALNVERAVKEFENAGACAIHIEDQLTPKRYKPNGMPQITDVVEHRDKITAAIQARSDENFLIIARTDSLARYGLSEAIKRAQVYVEAGADIVFVHGPKSVEDLEAIAREIPGPNILNYTTMIETGMKLLSLEEIEKMGYKIVIYPGELFFPSAARMLAMLKEIKETGGVVPADAATYMKSATLREILEWDSFEENETKYLPDR